MNYGRMKYLNKALFLFPLLTVLITTVNADSIDDLVRNT